MIFIIVFFFQNKFWRVLSRQNGLSAIFFFLKGKSSPESP